MQPLYSLLYAKHQLALFLSLPICGLFELRQLSRTHRGVPSYACFSPARSPASVSICQGKTFAFVNKNHSWQWLTSRQGATSNIEESGSSCSRDSYCLLAVSVATSDTKESVSSCSRDSYSLWAVSVATWDTEESGRSCSRDSYCLQSNWTKGSILTENYWNLQVRDAS